MVSTASLFVVSVALSCGSPSEPASDAGGAAAAARFAALAEAPAWTLGAARESTFSAAMFYRRETSDFVYAGARVARTSDRWATLWDTIVSTRFPPPALPVVDFAAEMVVLSAYGSKATGGYSIRIAHVTRQRDTTFVLVRTTVAGPRCGMTQGSTSPVDAWVVPSAPRPTLFLVEHNVYDCRTGRAVPVW